MEWRAEDGTGHATEEQAKRHNRLQAENMNAWMKLFYIIFLVLPVAITKFIAWVFGIFSGWGIVGKILQTTLFAVIFPFVLLIPLQVSGLHEIMPGFIDTFLFTGAFIFAGLWYWLWHYETVRRMDASTFSGIIKISFCICFYGYIIATIIGIASTALFTVLAVLIPIAASIFYFIKVKPYQEQAAQEVTLHPRRGFIMLIGGALVVILSVTNIISTNIDNARKIAQYRNEHSIVFEAAKNASRQNVTAVIVKDYHSGRGAPIYSGLDMGNVIKWLEVGNRDTLRITGEAAVNSRGGAWYWTLVPVEYEGITGYIQLEFLGIP